MNGSSSIVNAEPAYTLTCEFVPLQENFSALGVGVSYEFPRGIDRFAGEFQFIPVYGLVKIGKRHRTSPYFVGQVGYSFFRADDKYKDDASLRGGLHLGGGLGLASAQGFELQVLYSMDNGVIQVPASYFYRPYDVDVEYSAVRFSIGYSF